jgi:hypothetical protein
MTESDAAVWLKMPVHASISHTDTLKIGAQQAITGLSQNPTRSG